ncbi:MAG: efflux RND transporter periplasmic adaptor subunit [bacterium]
MRRKKLFLLIILIIGCTVIGWAVVRRTNHNNAGTLTLSGNIELTEVTIAFKIPGKIVELPVNEGDFVSKDALIAQLDQTQLIHQRNRARAVLTGIDAKLAQLRVAIEHQKETVEGQIAIREAELHQAQTRFSELEAGSRVQEIREAEAVVNRNRAEFEQAKKDLKKADTLVSNSVISQSQYDLYSTKYESAEASLAQAEERLALVREGARQEDIEVAKLQVTHAQANLRIAKAQHLEIKRKEHELEMMKAEKEKAQAELSLIESQIEDTIATAPLQGVVLVKAAEIGEVVMAGTPVVTIGDLFHPWFRGYINEKNLDQVKIGMRVKIMTDGGTLFWGRVSFISPEAEFTPKYIQTKEERVKLVYRIKVDIDNPEGILKANMPVEAQILWKP